MDRRFVTIARERVSAVLSAPDGDSADAVAAARPGGAGTEAEVQASPPVAAKAKSQVPVWREGLARTALPADYQRILAALADRVRLGQGPLTCQEMAALFGMDLAPGRFTLARGVCDQAAGHDHGRRPVDHRLGAAGAVFEVARQAAASHQVREETLDDPPLGQHHESAHVVAALDDRQHEGERGRAVLDEAAGVAAVGLDQFQQVVGVGDLAQQDLGGSSVAEIRARDHDAEQEAGVSTTTCPCAR